MIQKQYLTVLKKYLNNQSNDIQKELKNLIKTPEDKLLNSADFNFKNAGYKLSLKSYNEITLSKKVIIENTIKIFQLFHTQFSDNQIISLTDELLELPFEKISKVLYIYEETYFDINIYHILHFIKDTKYVLDNIDEKQRYHYSRFKIDVFKKQLKALETLKTEKFLLPSSSYDLDLQNTKEKLLKIANEHYNTIFAFANFYNTMPMKGMYKDTIIDDTINDFIKFVDAISITEKQAIKSLAILIYKMFEQTMNKDNLSYNIQNILRVFFETNIEEINQNKQVDNFYQDTFLINPKVFSKNVYIHSSFDTIPIFGMNKDNNYFFYKGLTPKDVMRIIVFSSHTMNTKLPLSVYKVFRKQYQNPHYMSYKKQYPEFFEQQDINIADIMATFFSEMKKSAPDNLK